MKGLNMEQITDLYKFVRADLSNKYNQMIDLVETEIVDENLTGDVIVDAIKVQFLPEDAKAGNIEHKIIGDLHRYIYDNDLGLVKKLNIEKDVWLGEIRYNIVYVYAGDYHDCRDCQRKCKQGVTRCLYYVPVE